MPTTYNFIESLERMDQFLGATISDQVLPSIPSVDELRPTAMLHVNGSVMSIRFDITEKFEIGDTVAKMAMLASFATETCKILRANGSCRDAVVTKDQIVAVYSTSLKTELSEVVDDAARIRTLSLILNKKYEDYGTSLKVGIGITYGRLDMSVAESLTSYKQYLWNGRTMDDAFLLSDKSLKADGILISHAIWKNLQEANQRLFKQYDAEGEEYIGKIVNIIMNNWLNSK